jgi:hypothetical protein
MERVPLTLGVLAICWFAPQAAAYKEVTHDVIARYAVDQSMANAPEIRQALFLGKDLNDPAYRLPKFGNPDLGIKLTPRQLVASGAREEDHEDRPLNHFYDPQRSGMPLTILLKEWGKASPDWALEDGAAIDGQDFSFRDAREYLRSALSGATEQERTRALGRVFEALGHVIHHVQDMTQPQHVRNDDHCDETVPYFIFSLYSFYYASPSRCQAVGTYDPSAYEDYVSHIPSPPVTGYPIPDYATFDSPRKWWTNSGKGSAEFASGNFVSKKTNFVLDTSNTPIVIRSDETHAFPRGSDARLTEVDINDPAFIRRVTEPLPMAGHISHVETPINDAYVPAFNAPNPYGSALSIWYDSVVLSSGEVQATPSNVFTLNGATHQAAANRLLPRAAAYSTGLINYFFRGRIEITLPSEGVYGVVDHGTTYATGQGFGKLKLKLLNASPDGVKPDGTRVPQTMQGGTLVAVAKYTLNSCYQPDLSGDYGQRYDTGEIVEPVNCSFAQYLAGEELISQSSAHLAASLDPVTPTEFTFDFSSQPIPVNARDLRVQVVYTGTLGAEADAIAFGGRDISEPTHLVIYNSSDYFAVDGKLYTPAQIRSDPALSQRVAGLNIDPRPLTGLMMAVVPGKPIVGASGAVPVNGYVRVAVLANPEAPISLSVLSRFEGTGFSEATFPRVWPSVTDLRSPDGYITPYGIFRGPRGSFFDVLFKANSSAPLASGELVNLSGRMVADPGPTPIPVRF